MNGSLNTFKYTAKLIQTFTLQPVGYKSNIFSFEIISWLRHDLTDHITHVESARLETWNRG